MPIPASECKKTLAVRRCGPRVIARPESIGITKLQDLPTAIPASSCTKSASPTAGQSGADRPERPLAADSFR
jgi:hypothetical protein